MNNIWEKIGKKIKEKRNQRGLTQGQLGKKVGAKKDYISQIERGVTPCSVGKLKEIADALDCNLKVVISD